jgi:hypothetical protein
MDIITLSETHINTHSFNNISELYSIPGYTFVHKNRTSGTHGGVGMYISDRIKWKRRLDLESDNLEGIWIEILQNKSKSYIIGTMYRPPDSSKHLPSDFLTLLNDTLSTIMDESKEVTLLGDLNINYLKKNDNIELKEMLSLSGFSQIITKATRITDTSQTLIDIVLTTNTSNIKAHDVFPTSIGDHNMIGYVRKMNNFKFKAKTIRCRNYTNYNHTNMASEVRNHNWNDLYKCTDVNHAWDTFKTTLTRIFSIHAPFIEKRVKDRYCPWLTTDIRGVMNDRDKAQRKARKSNKKSDWKSYKLLRNRCTSSIRKAKSECNKNLLRENVNKPRRFWQIIKEIIPFKANTTSSSTIIQENSDRPNIFCSFFTSVAGSLKRKSILLKDFVWHKPPDVCSTAPIFKFQYVPRTFVERELKKLKRHKATGIDNIPSNLLKDCATEISAPI